MIRKTSSRLISGIACLALVSCATIDDQAQPKNTPTVEPAGWVAEKEQRQQIKSWEIRGRLGVQTQFNGGSLDIIWKQTGETFTIRLIAPLGAGTYLIQGDNRYAEIRYPNGKKAIINDIDDVFLTALDVDLPVSAVKDWIRGLPAEVFVTDAISWNEKRLLHRLSQSGWDVEITKYAGEKLQMPHAIYLSRVDDEELDIRLLLRSWLFDASNR
ncbi:MAG: outer membrane lipoprotein LolB [Gammaproteobacteria bacterium]|nr:outer membrane lipoprotein LolB [Gammaproteobacteria bacterium]